MDSENFDVQIDESTHEEVPGIAERIKMAFLSIALAIIFVQVFYLWGFFKGYSLGLGTVFFDFSNPIFLGFLVICGLLGWFRGRKFTESLNKEIGMWKFW